MDEARELPRPDFRVVAASGPQPRQPRWSEESLMCRCPDCGAPLSVRRWLMAADCWQCGSSLEIVTRRL